MLLKVPLLAELQEERKSNEKKIAEKQKELDSLQSDLEEKEAYQKTLQEKITLQQSNLDIVSQELDRIAQSIDETTQAISQAEDDIKVMEADIAIGLDEFKMRLRAMYVQGNDSLASALVGATDFYCPCPLIIRNDKNDIWFLFHNQSFILSFILSHHLL